VRGGGGGGAVYEQEMGLCMFGLRSLEHTQG